MKIELHADTLDLQADQVLHLQDAAETTIVCLRGHVWITQEGDLRDIALEPGDAFTLDRPGMALTAALSASSIRIERPAVRHAPRAQTRRSIVPSWLPSFGPVAASLGVKDC